MSEVETESSTAEIKSAGTAGAASDGASVPASDAAPESDETPPDETVSSSETATLEVVAASDSASPDETTAPMPEPAPDPAPAKPAGPKLTPISQLSNQKAAVQRGRATVAPAPFRTDEEIATGAASAPAPIAPAAEPAPPPTAPAPPATPVRASASLPSISPDTPAASPPSGVAADDRQVDAQSQTVDSPGETAEAVTESTSKPSLRPMAAAAVSARARVAPPDPNRIRLEPEPPTPAELAAQAAERAAREQAEHERAMREQAEHERAMREQAAHVRAMREQAAHVRAMREQAAREEAAREHAEREQHERERAARERAMHEQAMHEQAMHQQAMREQATREHAAREQAERERVTHEQAMHEQAMHERAAYEHTMHEQAAAAAQAAAAHDRALHDQAIREQASSDRPRYGPTSPAQVTGEFPQHAPAGNSGARPPAPPVPPAPSSESVPVPPSPEKKRRASRVAVLAGLVVVVLLAAGFFVVQQLTGTAKQDLATAPKFAAPGAVLPDTTDNVPAPTAAGVAAAIAKPLSDSRLGTHVSVQVTDMATGEVLFGKNEDSPTTPASTMKLATGVSVLALRGPDYRITTRVVAGAKPGEVVLVGGGDPTLAANSKPSYPESGQLSDLANQVKAALGDVKPTKVIIDDSLFSGPTIGPGWEPSDVHSSYATAIVPLMTDGGRINTAKIGDTKRYDNPDTAAGDTFARFLGVPLTAVVNGKAPATSAGDGGGGTPGAVLGSVQSAPLVRIIETMLADSDNMLAEFMARQVAIAMGKPASFAGAAQAVTQELTKLGMPMQGVTIVDGSGLSPMNKLTAALLSAVLRYAASDDHPKAHALYTGLPVAGWSGTLAGRFKKSGTTAGQGLIRAKTGTLTGVSALAGTMIDSSGRTLVFVILLDRVPWGARVTQAIDKVSAAVQRCGCD